MAETDLPEDIIVTIQSWLPVKSLIRFTCVSKRFRFIILSDPIFAKSQYKAACEQKTLAHRLLLLSSHATPRLEFLDLETPSFGDTCSFRSLNFRCQKEGGYVRLLGSCNGLLFFLKGCDEFPDKFYICNPSTGMLKELPDPGFTAKNPDFWFSLYYGVGYLPATDNYKVFVASENVYLRHDQDFREVEAKMFSVRAHVWKRIESPPQSFDQLFECQGTVSNHALHWIYKKDEIVAFDLVKEEFRSMRLPNFDDVSNYTISHLGVCLGGCLSVSRISYYGSISLWVMREYDVSDSWTELFYIKFSNPIEPWSRYIRPFIGENSIIIKVWGLYGSGVYNTILMRFDGRGEANGRYIIEQDHVNIIQYEESLLWIEDYHGVEQKEQQVKILKTHYQSLQS
ncbi:F-box protein CPR1-like [Rosa sericea]